MSLPTPVQPPPRRYTASIGAGVLLIGVILLAWVNREPATGERRKGSSATKAGVISDRPGDLRLLAETVHLRYLESEGGERPRERLDRAIQRVARSKGVSGEQIRSALARYGSQVQNQPSHTAYEKGLAAFVAGDFEGAARAWPQGPEASGAKSATPVDPFKGYLASADAHLAAGRFDDAARACEDALRFLDRRRDPENWARARAALFIVRFNQGRMDDALSLAGEVLEVRERALSPDSPGIGNALLNYGVALSVQHRPDESVPLYERAIAIYGKAYGENDVAVADAASELADALGETDRPAEAEQAARRAVAIYQASGDLQSPRFALTLDRLGDILLTQQRPADAEAPLRQAMAIYDRLAHPQPKDHAGAQHRLGLAIARAGRRKEALPHLQRSAVLAAKYFSDDDPQHGAYYHNLAVWADAAGDDSLTVEAYGKALRIFALQRARTGRAPRQMDQTATFYAEYLRRAGVTEADIVRRQRAAMGDQ